MNSPSSTLKPLSINPAVLFEQAHKVERWCVRRGDGVDEPFWLLAFLRRSTPEEPCQLAVYQCDSHGHVLNWRERYDLCGENSEDEMFKLMYRIENDLAVLTPIEQIRVPPTDPLDVASSSLAQQRFERLFT